MMDLPFATFQGAVGLESLGGVDSRITAASESVATSLSTSEWLGPLAPIALSPFFGLTALSGIATYGPEWLQQRSALFSDSSMLNNASLFWTMLTLAVISSLPRLSKVSKPVALLAENLETYSAIIILFVVRTLGSGGVPIADETDLTTSSPVLVAGLPADVLMSFVAALNILVINGVKLFCEFLVWLIPFPTVDALVEAGNKIVCAALLGLYCFSPLAATVLNLLLLAICLVIFGWVYRRTQYYREVIGGPLLAWAIPKWFAQKGAIFRAFCDSQHCQLPRFSRVKVRRISERHFHVAGRWLWRSIEEDFENCEISNEQGLVSDSLLLTSDDGREFRFLHRKWTEADAMCLPKDRPQVPVVESA